jgi:hypothetical protein
MDIAGLQFWSDKMRIVLGIIFILFVICFVAIVIEETFLGGRRRRKAVKIARERNKEDGQSQ